MAGTTTTTLHPSQHTTMNLDEAMISRHSSRRFLPMPVPKAILHSALELATYSPSNSNSQPWRVYLLTGAATERLKVALTAAAEASRASLYTPIPPEYQPLRAELGQMVYNEGLGIVRADKEARWAAQVRNFDFFGAPTAAIVCIDREFGMIDALGVGMYLQNFLLALTEDGVNSCVEVSVAGYPDAIRKVVDIPERLDILCGVAIGYEDPTEKVNRLRSRKQGVEETTVTLED